jgi:hypothetical protein
MGTTQPNVFSVELMEARALHNASNSNKIKTKIQDFQSLTEYKEKDHTLIGIVVYLGL